MEARWRNWFEIAKLFGALVGIAAICVFQYRHEYSASSHYVLSRILVFNICEAILSDLQKGWKHLPNAFAGCVLVARISFTAEPGSAAFEHLATAAATRMLCVFPLEWNWILLYTTWNAAFSFGGNFSWSTRFMLLAPTLTVLCMGVKGAWLSARCVSLMLNMILRATETTDFYTPGRTALTFEPQTFVHNNHVHLMWSCLNAILALSISTDAFV